MTMAAKNNSFVPLCVGVCCVGVGYILQRAGKNASQQVKAIETTPLVTIDAVRLGLLGPGAPKSLYCHIAGYTSAGNMKTPRTAKLSGKYCIMSNTNVTRTFEEKTETTTDDIIEWEEVAEEEKGAEPPKKGEPKARKRKEKRRLRKPEEREYRWVKRTETLLDTTTNDRVYIYDGTASCEVTFQGLDVKPQLVEVVNHFDPRNDIPSAGAAHVSISYGNFSMSAGHTDSNSNTGDRKLIGYTFCEKILPVDEPVFAIGEAFLDQHGQVTFRHPSQAKDDTHKPYIFTRKSVTRTVQDFGSTADSNRTLSRISYFVGSLVVAYGLFSR